MHIKLGENTRITAHDVKGDLPTSEANRNVIVVCLCVLVYRGFLFFFFFFFLLFRNILQIKAFVLYWLVYVLILP